MARSKRNRTREEIEEALRHNADVNATPAAPEDAVTRRKRKQRKSAKARSLASEMADLTVSTEPAVAVLTVAVVSDVVPTTPVVPAVTDEPPTVAQDGKTEEDDPREHHCRVAPEYERQRLVALVIVPTTAPVVMSPASRRARNAEKQRIRRVNASSSQKERTRAQAAERQRVKRARMSEDQRNAAREVERLRQRQRRANRAQCERDEERARDREVHNARREGLTGEERTDVLSRNRVEQVARRTGLSQHLSDVERVQNRDRRAAVRASQTEEDREQLREQSRVRRAAPKHRRALINHENFRADMVRGKNIVHRRFSLPSTIVCPYCNAWKWPDESDNICCLTGKVQLPQLKPAPAGLIQLFGDPNFRTLIRVYNQAFAFTSIGASSSDGTFGNVNQDMDVAGGQGVYTYRIQGAMGHYLVSLLPYKDPNTGQPTTPKFAQIYVVDPDMQARATGRKGIFADLDTDALRYIEDMMTSHNPFAQQFLTFGEKLRQYPPDSSQLMDVVYRLHDKPSHPGTHNLPTVSEGGVTMIEDGNLAHPRDLLLYARDHKLLRLFETHNTYDPLQYPLLFPYGELGWTFTDQYANGAKVRMKREMPLRAHAAFRLFQKIDDTSALHLGGRLFQQWVVDQRAKYEQEQLRWVATHQKDIRADQYYGVRDAYESENTVALGEGEALLTEYDHGSGELVHPDRRPGYDHFLGQIGKRVILPETHVGSPRYMYKAYQDSMAILREYGKPDAFVTKTCNPKWDDILEKLPAGQTAQDRPDIVARVWQQYLRELLKDLDEGVIGRLVARIYVVEFQKRGLPHAHILTILDEEDKPKTRELIDRLVSAELPDKDINPELYETILDSMIHWPCGANSGRPCMKDGKCSKGYPKPLVEVTRANENGYPVYRRRRRPEGVLIYKGKTYDNATINQWVVPYNPYFSQKFNCHINVEVCTAITAVKYLYKYVYKESDKAVITIEAVRDLSEPGQDPNEVLRYRWRRVCVC